MTQSWKKGRPTETGWYWMCSENLLCSVQPCLIEKTAGLKTLWISEWGSEVGLKLTKMLDRYYFLGPIKPPDPPEVARPRSGTWSRKTCAKNAMAQDSPIKVGHVSTHREACDES